MFNDDLAKAFIKEIILLEEKRTFENLRKDGLVSEVGLFMNPKHKGLIEKAFYEGGLKRIPVIYSPVVEEDKAYCVTDKYLLENMKRTLFFEEKGGNKND